jgi:hypothetical protein
MTAPLPRFAGWRHEGAREGFEVVFLAMGRAGVRAEGHTTAIEDAEPFAVRYAIELDERWRTRSARVSGQSARGARSLTLESDGAGRWVVDGRAAPELDGCLDVDLESSALTNAFPVHRLALAPGEAADAPAAYVRALGLVVERLEQHYARIDTGAARRRFDYVAPAYDFSCVLVYDEDGLLLDYPGIATRAGV